MRVLNNQSYKLGNIERYFTGKMVLIFLLLSVAVYLYMNMVSMPRIAAFSQDMLMLDLKSEGYDYAYVKNLLDVLGEQGRSAYLFPQLILDMFFPLVYVPFFVLLIGYFLKKGRLSGTVHKFSLLIPILTGLADYGENTASILLIHSYPHISEGMVQFASVCTVVKSIGLVISLLLVVFYGVLSLFYRRNRR